MRFETLNTKVVLVIVFVLALQSAVLAQQTTLSFWHPFSTDHPLGQALNASVSRFNELHPDITVNVEVRAEGGFFFDNYMVAILGGAGPDVMWFERSAISNWARSGLLEPLTGLDLTAEDFLPAPFSEVIWEGDIWGVPWNTDIRGLFWNMHMLDRAGLDSVIGPQTWDDFNEWHMKLTQRSGDELIQVGLVPWNGNWFFPAWVWTFGGELYDAQNRRATFNSPEAIEALTWMQSFLDDFSPIEIAFMAGGNDPFIAERQALYITGPAALPIIEDSNPNLEIGMGPVPHPPGGKNGTWGGGYAIVVPQGSRLLDAAMQFTRWMASEEAQTIYADISDSLPTNATAARAYVAKQPGRIQRLYDQTNEANIRYPFVWLDVFNAGLEVYNLLLEGNLEVSGIMV